MLGKKADALWLAYATASAPGEKQEIEIVLNILATRHLQASFEPTRILLPPPPRDVVAGPYQLGNVVYNEEELYPFGLREDEWIQHVGIFGRSGAGKTNLALNVISTLIQHKKPVLIFDWKRNYRDLLTLFPGEPIRIFTVGRDVAPIQFNPLIPPAGTQPDTWLKKLIEIIATTYFVGEGVISLLLKAIDAVYKDAGVYDGRPEEWPTMLDVLAWLQNYRARGREHNWLTSTFRAVMALCYGEMGRIVNVNQQFPIADLLRENVVLELDSLTSSDKTFLIESLLLWTYHYRMAEGGREEFKHVILIEEAHHILTRQEASRKEGITDIILREIRELGESVLLLDQLPSQITPTALANTHTTFTFNLKNRGCVSTATGYTLLGNDDRECFGRLPVGHAIVKLQGRWFQPFLVRIPRINIRKGSVSDAMLRQLNRDCSSDSGQLAAPPKPKEKIPGPPRAERKDLSDDEKALLSDVLTSPFTGVSKRYSRLGWSRRRGNDIKTSLVDAGALAEVSIPLASGRLLLLDTTRKGRDMLGDAAPSEFPVPGRHSLEHEYWRAQVAQAFTRDGYAVEAEKEVSGGTVDLVAAKGKQKIGIEIETGKSNISRNLAKAKHFARLVVVPTNSAAERKVMRALRDTSPTAAKKTTMKSWKEFC